MRETHCSMRWSCEERRGDESHESRAWICDSESLGWCRERVHSVRQISSMEQKTQWGQHEDASKGTAD
jgi:hypothetical protein